MSIISLKPQNDNDLPKTGPLRRDFLQELRMLELTIYPNKELIQHSLDTLREWKALHDAGKKAQP